MSEIIVPDYIKHEKDALKELLEVYSSSDNLKAKYSKQDNFVLHSDDENLFLDNLELILNENNAPFILDRFIVNSLDDKSWIYIKLISENNKYIMNFSVPKIDDQNIKRKNFLQKDELLYVNSLKFKDNKIEINYNDDKVLKYDVLEDGI